MGLGRALLWLIGREPDLNTEESRSSSYLIKQAPSKFIYSPSSLDEYIGQEIAKENVKYTLMKLERGKIGHILITGLAGYGKTTLANIIAKQLNAKIFFTIGGSFNIETLQKFLLENEQDRRNLHILFIDETHAVDKKLAEMLYPLMTDFMLPTDGTKVKPFLIIGATTDQYLLAKKMRPFLDRFSTKIDLEIYSTDNIKTILRQYNEQVYKENIDDDIFELLALNSRNTPRIGISLLDLFVITKDIKAVLRCNRIIKNSLTDTDVKVLKHLEEVNKAVGEETLAIVGQVERSNYRHTVAPYLIAKGYLSKISKGQQITEAGRQILSQIRKEETYDFKATKC